MENKSYKSRTIIHKLLHEINKKKTHTNTSFQSITTGQDNSKYVTIKNKINKK